MQVLILQFASPRAAKPLPIFSHDLGVLAAALKADGFSCRLATLAGYQPRHLRNAVIEHRPRYVLAEVGSHSVAAAHRTIGHLAEKFSLPVAVLGAHATCRPGQAASIPGVHALLLGEYETTGVALLRAVRDGADPEGMDGLWLNSADGLVKGPLPSLSEDLDALPLADREFFDYERIVRATGEAGFKIARGCDLWCAYCPNDWYMDLYAGKGAFVRRRSVGGVLDEIAAVVGRYDAVRSVRFYDHCFATDTEWLARFAAEYPRRVSLPYRCFLPLSHATERVADLLAESGCGRVDVQFGSGSRLIREDILSIRISDQEIVDACRILRLAGLNVAAEVFVGCPYESPITVEETLALIRSSRVDHARARLFYPTPGTRAAELCAENGWISGRGERGYWSRRSVLDMPSMSADVIDTVFRKFPQLMKRPSAAAVRKAIGKISRGRGGIGSLLRR